MPFLGLKGLITSGASLDLILGIALICYVARESGSYRLSYVLSTIGMCGIVGTILFVNLDSYKMGSGVYRLGILDSPNNVKLLFHKDGKTATVSNFLSKDGGMSIRTNGKIDAAVMTTPGAEAHPDESTMMLTGVIPMTLHPSAKTAACIGLGSGITSNTILSNPSIQQLDTIEIEKAMIEGAKFFRPRVELVYTDPRSRIYNDDAKTFFSTYNKKYDLIVSEPSNPWVSGVAGLFSEEFYRLIKHHLNDDGMFVQWVQLYEINVDLVVSVLKAVALNFPDYAVYATNNSDMVIVAKKKGLLKQPDYSILKSPTLANDLKRIHINNGQDIAIRMIGSKRFLQNFLESYSIRPNSDYYPVLDQNAARTRFLNESADSFTYFSHSMVPVLEMLDKSTLIHNQTNISPSPYFDNSKEAFIAMKLRDYFLLGKYTPLTGLTDLMQMAQFLKQSCDGNINISQNERLAIVHSLTITMTPYLSPSELDSFWILLESGACFKHKTPKEQQFYKLFESIGNRNASQMLESARTLLQSSDDLSPKVRHYLLVSGMLGALANGNRAEANRLWTLYKSQISGSIETDLLVRLLVAESRVN
jgi:spermidine synthase